MTAAQITTELITRDLDGVRVAYLLPVVPDSAPPSVKEGFARRRLAVLTDTCPCGARSPLNQATRRRLAKARGQVAYHDFLHQSDCPGADANLADAIWRWSA